MLAHVVPLQTQTATLLLRIGDYCKGINPDQISCEYLSDYSWLLCVETVAFRGTSLPKAEQLLMEISKDSASKEQSR